jgi:hypothetical protein
MLSVFDPPWKVGIAPTVSPVEFSIDTLCPTDEALVKSIVTLPALADSDFVLN